DIYGAEPHIITGDLNMVNLGPLISWISLESTYGTVQGNTVFSNMVYFDSEGMSDGEYHCELIVNEQFQIVKIIPVTLLVDQNLGILVSGLSQKEPGVYPNPFRQNTRIEYHQETSGVVDLRIYDLRGSLIRILTNHVDIPSGKHSILWDGKDNDGFQVPEGVYIISLVQSGNQHFIKTLKID
ncbi:MAG: FlgD immunoglobulin-like domain containing protein, partial [Bacteroidota bacterium]|nr:FlgD immunoglobulin-like domain containing protein [Bacteroidota bacterium]